MTETSGKSEGDVHSYVSILSSGLSDQAPHTMRDRLDQLSGLVQMWWINNKQLFFGHEKSEDNMYIRLKGGLSWRNANFPVTIKVLKGNHNLK